MHFTFMYKLQPKGYSESKIYETGMELFFFIFQTIAPARQQENSNVSLF